MNLGDRFNWLRGVLASSRLRHSQKTVAASLFLRANDHGEAWPSVATIAADTGLSVRAVHNALRSLEAVHAIESTDATPGRNRQIAGRPRNRRAKLRRLRFAASVHGCAPERPTCSAPLCTPKAGDSASSTEAEVNGRAPRTDHGTDQEKDCLANDASRAEVAASGREASPVDAKLSIMRNAGLQANSATRALAKDTGLSPETVAEVCRAGGGPGVIVNRLRERACQAKHREEALKRQLVARARQREELIEHYAYRLFVELERTGVIDSAESFCPILASIEDRRAVESHRKAILLDCDEFVGELKAQVDRVALAAGMMPEEMRQEVTRRVLLSRDQEKGSFLLARRVVERMIDSGEIEPTGTRHEKLAEA